MKATFGFVALALFSSHLPDATAIAITASVC